MGITENAAYLKGLAEGMKLDESTNEGKLIVKMLDLIGEMAEKIDILQNENDELYTYMEGMAEDLVHLEDDFYGDDECECEDYSDLNEDDDDDDVDFSDEEYYEIECPTCGEKICFTEEFDLDNFLCPACGNKIDDVELIDDCDDCAGCLEDCDAKDTCEGCKNH